MQQNFDPIISCHNSLIEELSQHFEDAQNLPPLASKIYSHLIMCNTKALTFEDIITLTGASKSSVSNQLNFLIEEGRVDFNYKNDKRKRYFKTKNDYLSKTLELHLEKIQKEIEMLSKIIQHKDNEDFNKKLVAIFKDHLKNEKENILNTIDNLKQTSYNLEHHEK